MGMRSNCKVKLEKETKLMFISENKLVVNNAQKEKLSSNCGPNNRTLSGNFLITFWNCTITIKNREFESYDITSEVQEKQGAFYNLQATRQLIETLNFDTINQENIQNRQQIKNVYLKQLSHKKWIWTLSGGFSISSITIILLILYITLHNHRTATVKIVNPNIPNAGETNHLEQTTNLLKETPTEIKDEDALFSPPGGVTLQHSCVAIDKIA